jgi:hypothetical protein
MVRIKMHCGMEYSMVAMRLWRNLSSLPQSQLISRVPDKQKCIEFLKARKMLEKTCLLKEEPNTGEKKTGSSRKESCWMESKLMVEKGLVAGRRNGC